MLSPLVLSTYNPELLKALIELIAIGVSKVPGTTAIFFLPIMPGPLTKKPNASL